MQIDWPTELLYFPGVQSEHVVWPRAGELALPAGHVAHDVAPVSTETVPGGQVVQYVESASAEKWPLGQSSQIGLSELGSSVRVLTDKNDPVWHTVGALVGAYVSEGAGDTEGAGVATVIELGA